MALRRKARSAEVDLDSLVVSGDQGAYEALQLFKSRAMRFKTKDDNITNAINVAIHGAKALLSKGYVNAGAELANLVIDFINEAGMEINPQMRTLLFEVDNEFPPANPFRIEFLKACVKSTIANGQREMGDPVFHLRLANCLWEIKDKNAIYHFVLSEEPELLSQKIDAMYGRADEIVERDRKFTLAILHFLALENLRDAHELFRFFKKSQKVRKLPTNSELVTFCDYLVQLSRRDAAPLFKTLVNKYADALNFDETAPTLVMGPIAQRLFNIQPKANPVMSMLQNLLT
jgi:hypothetical protein